MTQQPVWFCPCFAMLPGRGGAAVLSYGKKFKSEEKARDAAARIAAVFNRARMDGDWAIGVGRSFNRDARPSSVAWASTGETTIPDLPPVKP